MSLKPGDRIRDYEIAELVGHGGMSSVYRAFQPALNRHVAIKVLPEFLAEDEAFHERFIREAATVAQLRHPNIVRVFDYNEEKGVPYIVMEFLPGDHLGHRLGEPLSLTDSLAILRPLADALDYAHARGVVHRDVKPQNVMLGPDGVPVLTDFGLAHIRGSMPRLTRSGVPVGTAEYMAPEQANGDIANPSVDRYALAVVGYEMLAGRVPFTRKTELAVLLAHVNEDVPPPSSVNPLLSPAVDGVLLNALAKSPDDRYPTAAAFVEALAQTAHPADAPGFGARIRADNDGTQPQADAPGRLPGRVEAWTWDTDTDDAPIPEENLAVKALVEALQQPLTQVPLFVGGLALTYLVILSPIVGFALPAAIIAAAGLVAGVTALFKAYPDAVMRVEDEADKRHRERDERRKSDELTRLRQSIREGLEGANLPVGLTALEQLSREFDSVQPALTRRATDPVAMTLLPNLAGATYRLGLNLLADALGRANPSHDADVARLRREIAEDERQLAGAGASPTQAERLRLVRDFLQSRKESLEMLETEQLNVERLCFEAQRCAVSLQRTRAELVVLRTHGTAANVDSLIQALQGTIEQAKDVQEEIRKLGYS